ncbi:GNAT family N-acetyltransferase [Flindersiella endophytica]
MRYLIRQATNADLDTILAIRKEAAQWLKETGVRQWTDDYSEYAEGLLKNYVKQGSAWIIEDQNGQPAGTVTLNGPDRDFWTSEDRPDDALYLIKMAVLRAHSGRALGDAIINWASSRARLAGKKWLRLDCRRDNTKLHHYYLLRGFTHLRTVDNPPRRTESGALFQRTAGYYHVPPVTPSRESTYLDELPLEGDRVPNDATKPEPQPVVAAIVTSKLGVLIGKRNDNRPPWTFIAGEIEPGESAADAAVREVKEETGLLVRASEREIGRRIHPKTGRTMIYLACKPVAKTDIFVGDEDELAEVRWASLQEAEELLPGLFPPVHVHLLKELG